MKKLVLSAVCLVLCAGAARAADPRNKWSDTRCSGKYGFVERVYNRSRYSWNWGDRKFYPIDNPDDFDFCFREGCKNDGEFLWKRYGYIIHLQRDCEAKNLVVKAQYIEMFLYGHTLTVDGDVSVTLSENSSCDGLFNLFGGGGTISFPNNTRKTAFDLDFVVADKHLSTYIRDVTFKNCKGRVFEVKTRNPWYSQVIEFKNVVFDRCTAGSVESAEDGACIYVDCDYTSTYLELHDCSFRDCLATRDGGAVYINDFADTSIVNFYGCTAVNCIAQRYGGFMYVDKGTAKVHGHGTTVISGCKATYGGGVYANRIETFDGFILADNRSAKNGGGMYNYSGWGKFSGNSTVSNCNFYRNFAGNKESSSNGGGLYMYGGQVKGCKFYNNTAYGKGAEVFTDRTVDGCTFLSDFGTGDGAVRGNPVDNSTFISENDLALTKGAGTEADPYRIECADDWDALYYAVRNGRTFENEFLSLSRDIAVVNPVGVFDSDPAKKRPFKGTFDGKRHAIIMCYTADSNSDKAVFGCAQGATVRNLTVKGAIRGDYSLGGIFGNGSGCIAENCVNKAEIKGLNDYIGGIAGWSGNGAKFLNCVNCAAIEGQNCVGGIAGRTGEESRFLNCLNQTDVTAGEKYAGGIVGFDESAVSFANCHMFGAVAAQPSYCGPISGSPASVSTRELCLYCWDHCPLDHDATGVPHDALWGRAVASVDGKDFRMPDYVNDYIVEHGKEADGWLRVAFDRGARPVVVPNGPTDEFGYSVGRISDTEELFWKLGKLYSVKDGVRTEVPCGLVSKCDVLQNECWYAAEGDVSLSTLQVGWDGEGHPYAAAANIVLTHGSSLTVKGGAGNPGILVHRGRTLRIFGSWGGSLTAIGGEDAAGIGGGNCCACGTVKVYGGAVTAQGGGYDLDTIGAAGIGGGYGAAGGTVEIHGGRVTAMGGNGAANIGAGCCYVGDDKGTLTLGERVLKFDNSHWAEWVTASFRIPDGLRLVSARTDTVQVEVTEEAGNFRTVRLPKGDRLTLTFGSERDPAVSQQDDEVVTIGPIVENVDIGQDELPKPRTSGLVSVEYVGSDGQVKPASARPLLKGGASVLMTRPWYVVKGSVDTADITVQGNVNLILADDGYLDVYGKIQVLSGGHLTIYGQSGGTGKLNMRGDIGGTVTINGGQVKVMYSRITGTVTINGGEVWADRITGAVTINGGTVTASGNISGRSGTYEVVRINGGSVTAKAITGFEKPKNDAGKSVRRVSVECAGMTGLVRLDGLGDYGTRDIHTYGGRVDLWLPDGTHRFSITDKKTGERLRYIAIVNGRNITVEPLPPVSSIGFYVNGKDIWGAAGTDGWSYDCNSKVLSIETDSDTYVLSGVATNDEVQIDVRTHDVSLVFSNALICTQGRPALKIGSSRSVSLGMTGDASYLAAKDASAVERGWKSECTVVLAPGGDRLESMIGVLNSGDYHPAIAGEGELTVESGTFFVQAKDEQAVEYGKGFNYADDSELMAVGDGPENATFATEVAANKYVLVAPFCRVRMPVSIQGIESYVVKDTTEELVAEKVDETNVYKAMVLDDITVDFTAAPGYEIVGGASVTISRITNDVTYGSADFPPPDIRKRLTVTLPEVDGLAFTVWEEENEVKVKGEGEGVKTYSVLSGYDVEIRWTERSGWRIVSETDVVRIKNIQEDTTLTAAELPVAKRLFKVTVPEWENDHVIHRLKSTDKQMTAVGGWDAVIYTILADSEVTVTFAADAEYDITANGEKTWTLTGDVVFGTTEGFELPTVAHREVEYVDSEGRLQENATFTVVTAETGLLGDGWYLVEGTSERGALAVAEGCTANLILADGATLTVESAPDGEPGIGVGSGRTLNIYGQSGGSGRLEVCGGKNGAGIGGGDQESCGTVAIYGGTVMAQGGEGAAGIGGGCDSVSDGTVTLGARVKLAEGALGKSSSYVVLVEKTTAWPDDPTTVAGRSAAEAYRIPTTAKLADADAGAIATWAKVNTVDVNDFMADPDAYEKAFLLNCGPNEAETEAAAYRITGFGQNADGEWEVSVKTENNSGYPYNGRSGIQCFSDAACATPFGPEDDPSSLFIRSFLLVAPAEKVPSDHHGIVVPGPVRIDPER